MAEILSMQGHGTSEPYKKVYATDLGKTRRAMNRLLNAYLSDPAADTPRFRAAIYALKSIAETHRAERDQELEERLERIEKELGIR